MTAASHRLMNTDATEPTLGLSPASMRRSMPRRNASAAARYCSRENSRVTLTGTPAKIASSMAGSPSWVPGILMNRLGRAALGVQVRHGRHGAARVVGQERRDFQRHPPVHAVGPLPDGSEQVGGPCEVLQGQLEEELFARFPRRFVSNGSRHRRRCCS